MLRPPTVFLEPDVSYNQIEAVEAVLESRPEVYLLRFYDKSETFEEFLLTLDDPTLEITADAMPPSYRFLLRSPMPDEVVAQLREMPGVRDVMFSYVPPAE